MENTNVIEMESPHDKACDPRMQIVAQPSTPDGLLQIAVQRGASMEELERLMALKERFEANEARKAYVLAMAAFKENPPDIIKDKQVAFGDTKYMHATIGNVTNEIVSSLAKHGFSHRWNTEQKDGGQIVVTCILTHKLGHSESTTLQSSRDDSGKKNNIQAMSSAITYLQRYTLLAATGLATRDQTDDDGHGAEDDECEFDVDNFIAEVKKFTKDALALDYWKKHSPKFANHKSAYKKFKDATAAHRQFIKEADEVKA